VDLPVVNIAIPISVTPQTTNLTFNQNLQVTDFEEDPTTNDDDNDTISTAKDDCQ
jgi:hypothetical protein